MTVNLPARYRFQEVKAFHSRDPEALAEHASDAEIRKALVLDGVPTLIVLRLGANAEVESDGQPERVRDAAERMLGLKLDPTSFEEAFAADPVLGPLIAARPGLRIAQTPTVFEALSWAIIGQQINLTFAVSLRRAFIRAAGVRHPSGLWCYPGPAEVAALDPAVLTAQRFSRAKAEALVRMAQAALPLEEGPAIAPHLLALKGIGPWTVEYTLLRGYGHPDCALHGDAAVRNALQRGFGMAEKLTATQAEELLGRFRPHRSLAAAHLWASKSMSA